MDRPQEHPNVARLLALQPDAVLHFDLEATSRHLGWADGLSQEEREKCVWQISSLQTQRDLLKMRQMNAQRRSAASASSKHKYSKNCWTCVVTHNSTGVSLLCALLIILLSMVISCSPYTVRIKDNLISNIGNQNQRIV